MEYALSSLFTLLLLVVVFRRQIKRAVLSDFAAGPSTDDLDLQSIIADERRRMARETSAQPRVGEAKIRKQIAAKGWFAHVRLRCRSIGQGPTTICVLPTAAGEVEQSEGWADGAVAGVDLGLRLAATTADCEITLVHGMPADSRPMVFAIAGIRAVWQAVSFEPPAELDARLDAAMRPGREMTVADLAAYLR